MITDGVWEIFPDSDSLGGETHRLKVPGGWLVKYSNLAESGNGISITETMVFVLDPGQTWKLEE